MNKKLLSIAVIAFVAVLAMGVGGISPTARAAAGGTISGRVVNDVNQDGVAQADEPGLSGWRVTLDHPGEESREAHTDSNGRFSFSSLSLGDYDVDLSCDGQPSLWGATPGETTGFSFTFDSGADRSDVDFPVVPIATPPSRPHTATIAGRVVLDEDRDGNAENSEPGIAGWPLTASPVDALNTVCFSEPEKQATTDSSGRFTFSGLAPGHYLVYEDGSQQAPLKLWADYGPGRTISREGDIDWILGEPVETQAGQTSEATIGVISLEGTASVSGSVYGDLNRNGRRDADEPVAQAGAWMSLSYRVADGYVTGAPLMQLFDFGNPPYRFSGLAPGDYAVMALFQFSTPVNPPGDQNGVSFSKITVSGGQQLTDVDFGFESIPSNLLAGPTVEPTLTPQPIADTPVAPTSVTPLVPGSAGGSGSVGRVAPPSTGDGTTKSGFSSRELIVSLAAGSTLLAVGIVFSRRKGPSR